MSKGVEASPVCNDKGVLRKPAREKQWWGTSGRPMIFRGFYAEAEFRLTNIIRTGLFMAIIEGVPD